MIKPPENLRSFEALVEVVKALRHPIHGCPWDLEQTHESLTKHMIEEAFELIDAIEKGDRENFIEELGDVLLQVILHSVIANQNGSFELLDVIESLNTKLVTRHSHVFGDVKADSAHLALANWEKMKAEEKKKKSQPPVDHFEIPTGLPALQRAQKIGSKTRKFNFDWTDIKDVKAKVLEELNEFDEALKIGEKEELEHEMGDILFSVVQMARHAEIDAEAALRKTNSRFEKRFFKMKALADDKGLKLENMSVEEMEKLWQEAKKLTKP